MASLTTRPHLHTTCLMFGHRGVGQEVRHLRISGGLDGGFSYWRAFPQGWAFQTSPREVDHHPRGSSFCGVCGFCSGVQPAVVKSWCPPQELQFPAPSSLCSADSSVWRSPCGWSWTKVLQARVRAIRQADRRQAHQWLLPDRKKSRPARRRHPRRRLLGLPCLQAGTSTTQRRVTQEPPFPAGAGRAHPRPFQGSKKSGKSSSSAAKKRWRVPGGGSPSRLCPALAESAGQLPGHRHRRGRGGHCIPATTSAHPSKHQFPDQEQPTRPSASRWCLADEGSHRTCHQREVPGFLQSVVSGTQEDRRSATCDRPVHSQPSHGGSTLQDGDARVRPISHQKSGVGGVDRHTRCLSSCADASSCLQVSAFRGQQEGVPVHLSSVWTWQLLHGSSPSCWDPSSLLRQQGVKLHVYLDDWLIRVDTAEEAQLHAQTTIKVLQFLGWIINFEKSDLTPSQDFQFIGIQFNTRRFTVAPLTKMRVKVQSVHQHWMANPNITARDLHRLLGMLVFMASLVRWGRLRLRPVQWWAATAWCQRTGNWSERIQVPQWVLSEVAWWSSPAVLQGLPLAARETEVTLFTDASSSGWGAQLGSHSTQGQWSASQRLCHINVLEMQAVIYAVRDFLPHLRYRVVRLMCDNAVTVAYIKNEGGTRSHTLMQMTIRLLKWCDSKAITLVHLPGVRNIQADSLSRVGQTLTTEWTMAMESLRPVFAKWGEPQIDMFATFANRRLVKFVSPYLDPRAEWTDAMSMPWDKERGLLYAFPPFKMIPQVLQKIAQSPGVQMILIAQLQPAASWFPELMDLAQEDPVPLFVEGQDLLTQDVCMGGGVTETRHFRPWNLHAWKLSGPFWEPRVIPGKLPTWCQDAYENSKTSVWISLVKIRGVL